VLVNVHVPAAFTIAVPMEVEPLNIVTTAPASAVPLTVGVLILLKLAVGEVMVGVGGAMVSAAAAVAAVVAVFALVMMLPAVGNVAAPVSVVKLLCCVADGTVPATSAFTPPSKLLRAVFPPPVNVLEMPMAVLV